MSDLTVLPFRSFRSAPCPCSFPTFTTHTVYLLRTLWARGDPLAVPQHPERGRQAAHRYVHISYTCIPLIDRQYRCCVGRTAARSSPQSSRSARLQLHPHPLELPVRDDHPQARRGARRRLHRGHQAPARDAVFRARARRGARSPLLKLARDYGGAGADAGDRSSWRRARACPRA